MPTVHPQLVFRRSKIIARAPRRAVRYHWKKQPKRRKGTKLLLLKKKSEEIATEQLGKAKGGRAKQRMLRKVNTVARTSSQWRTFVHWTTKGK